MITIYSFLNCKHCMRAKELMIEKGILFEDINLKDHKNRDARAYYRSIGATSVPIIKFDDGTLLLKFNEMEFLKLLEKYEKS